MSSYLNLSRLRRFGRLSILSLLIVFGFVISSWGLGNRSVHAQDPLKQACGQIKDAEVCAQQAADPKGDKVPKLMTNIITFIIYLTGTFSVLMVVLGSFKYVTSQGEANQIKSAKDTILWALIGLVISINAMFVVRFAISRL
jgi:hypothetical protein